VINARDTVQAIFHHAESEQSAIFSAWAPVQLPEGAESIVGQ
jgi:hypothetical protein